MRRTVIPALAAAIITLASACDKIEDAGKEAALKAAVAKVKEATGADISVKQGGAGVTMKDGASEYDLSINQPAAKTGDKEKSAPLAPPGAVIESKIRGKKDDTFNFSTVLPLDMIEKFYKNSLEKDGYKEVYAMKSPGNFSGMWAKPDLHGHVTVYVWETGESRIHITTIIAPPAG